MRRLRPIADRLWAKVERRGPDECWEWTGARRKSGHGTISLGRAGEGATSPYRVAWQLANGPIPAGLVVRHSCDNPPCCNPAHLVLGTVADNIQDAKDRNRWATEFRMPHTKLSNQDVHYIREHFWRRGAWTNAGELAEQFGVTRDHITRICRGARRTAA